jgi:hypothetical protein
MWDGGGVGSDGMWLGEEMQGLVGCEVVGKSGSNDLHKKNPQPHHHQQKRGNEVVERGTQLRLASRPKDDIHLDRF